MKAIEKMEKEIMTFTAEYDCINVENATLHSWLKSLVAQYESEKSKREEEKEMIMQKNFDIRMSMDQILRKSIHNFDSDYQLKAVSVSSSQ